MIFLIYLVLAYIAVAHTIWAGKIVIGYNLFLQRVVIAMLLGWILIPWWFLKALFGRKR